MQQAAGVEVSERTLGGAEVATTLTWSLIMLHVSGTAALYSRAKAWLPVRGAPKV